MLWLSLLHPVLAADCRCDFIWGDLQTGVDDVPVDVRPWFTGTHGSCEEVALSWRLETFEDALELWVVADEGVEALTPDGPVRLALAQDLAADALHTLTVWTVEHEDYVTFTTGSDRVASPVGQPVFSFDEAYLGDWPGNDDVTWHRIDVTHDPDTSGAGLIRFYEVGVDGPLDTWGAATSGTSAKLIIQDSDEQGERCFEVGHEDGAGLAEVRSEPVCVAIAPEARGCSTSGTRPGAALAWLGGWLILGWRRRTAR